MVWLRTTKLQDSRIAILYVQDSILYVQDSQYAILYIQGTTR